MKKLNRKGFTLIELLAVIVILAIIIALVFPQIMNVIDDSKISTMHSNAKGIEKWWETTISADEISTGDKQIPAGLANSITTSWKCMNSITSTDGQTFWSVAKLADSDYVVSGNEPVDGQDIAKDTCSAVRYSNGGLEVLLVAKEGGKNYIAGSNATYAFSTASGGNINPYKN